MAVSTDSAQQHHCTVCGRPICGECAMMTSVGQLCPDDRKARRPSNYKVSAKDVIIGGVVAFFASALVALDSAAAHLAEQLALKAFVPVVGISDDKRLTSTNVPWIFRLPAGTTPASAMRLLLAAASQSGSNPERLRDLLASGHPIAGVAFLPTGEPRQQ